MLRITVKREASTSSATKEILEGVAVKGNLLDMICNKISLQVTGSHDAEGHALRQNLGGAEHLHFLVFDV